MKNTFGFPKKMAITAAAFLCANFAFSQSIQEAVNSLDANKFAKAKNICAQLNSSKESAQNYYYLGLSYLMQNEADLNKASENFNKGLSLEPKNYLNQAGIVALMVAKGDIANAKTKAQDVAKMARDKDPEVVFRLGQAFMMFDKKQDVDFAIENIKKAIDLAKDKNTITEEYYNTLGDAYRVVKNAGPAMSAYDNALEIAKNKASVYSRIGTLWLAAQQWERAKKSIDQAIATDVTYAPGHKAMYMYNQTYQNYAEAAKNLKSYLEYADEDPNTILTASKLYFASRQFTESEQSLDKVFDKVDDLIKYKLKAYLQYNKAEYAPAQTNLENFISKAEPGRITSADQGLLGLLTAAKSLKETDAKVKASLVAEAQQKISLPKAEKDTTLEWDNELIKTLGSELEASAAKGKTTPEIDALKTALATDAQNTDTLYKLATAYEQKGTENWPGSATAWMKMTQALPTWEPGFSSLGYALQKSQNNELSKIAYQKYVSLITAKPMEEQVKASDNLSAAYYTLAVLHKDDVAKAKDYLQLAINMNPGNKDALQFQQKLK